MTKLRLEEADLIMNKNPRMPICIVVETSDVVLEDAANLRNIQRGIDRLSKSICESISLKALADVCIICFGAEAKVTREFGTLEDAEKLSIERMGGKADLDGALSLLIHQYRIRLNDYEENQIKRYMPVFFILGRDADQIEEKAGFSQIRHWSRTQKISVIPVCIDGSRGNALRSLTADGIVYEMNSLNYEKIFEMLGKSIEMLSRSSASAVESLQLKSIEWDQFRRR